MHSNRDTHLKIETQTDFSETWNSHLFFLFNFIFRFFRLFIQCFQSIFLLLLRLFDRTNNSTFDFIVCDNLLLDDNDELSCTNDFLFDQNLLSLFLFFQTLSLNHDISEHTLESTVINNLFVIRLAFSFFNFFNQINLEQFDDKVLKQTTICKSHWVRFF